MHDHVQRPSLVVEDRIKELALRQRAREAVDDPALVVRPRSRSGTRLSGATCDCVGVSSLAHLAFQTVQLGFDYLEHELIGYET